MAKADRSPQGGNHGCDAACCADSNDFLISGHDNHLRSGWLTNLVLAGPFPTPPPNQRKAALARINGRSCQPTAVRGIDIRNGLVMALPAKNMLIEFMAMQGGELKELIAFFATAGTMRPV